MVARINTGKSISKALNYNEKKVQQGHAELLLAHNFLKDADQMNFYEKLGSFEKLTSLNERTTTNTLHVSLNFDPSEKLENEKLIAIAGNYMKRIGFGDQPYLVYRHFDTGHPHIHIISTNIQRDGSRISMHNLGRNQSELARKEIEVEFGLIRAESKKASDALKLQPVNAQKLNPGKRSTKAAISNVLGVVIPQYKYGSLAELNAILKLYNVMADRCSEASDTYRHKGLLYRVLDEKGNKVGTPIKASLFYIKPTLHFLEKRFAENEVLKQPHSKRLRTAIDYALLKRPAMTLPGLIADLNRERISTVIRQNKDGVIYGITYVDHRTKCVFNGSDLGKPYSAKKILERCNKKENDVPLALADEKKKSQRAEITLPGSPVSPSKETGTAMLDAIIKPENVSDYIPYQLKKAKRKRKEKKIDDLIKQIIMNTGENEQGLRKILDMTRLISIVVLVLHFYYYCYRAFEQWQLTAALSDRLLGNIKKTGLFSHLYTSKFIALAFLIISLMGARGKKEEKLNFKTGFAYIIGGLLTYFLSWLVLLPELAATTAATIYIGITSIGFILILTGGTLLSRVIQLKLNNRDIFNKENETFPQEERLLQNEFSINLPAQYNLKGKIRSSWINIINPFRSLLVMGSPGAGKSYFVIRHVITQHIRKGFSMFIYDFKFDDLSVITYNHFLQHRHLYKVKPEFYLINFDDLSRTHRCNPLDKENMLDITDASESARTILMGLNREWIRRQGDFFVESPINFLTAIIWFLRRYQDGEFCTLPHVIELMQVEYDKLFTILKTEKEIEALINPFVSAYVNDVMEQLEGQIAAAKVAMARLSSPQLYYVLSGNDFTLDINNPKEPKIVCMGNNPQKLQVYGAVLSLYISRLIKMVNKKGNLKSSLIFDEFPTIYLNNMDSLIATARSNKVATILGVQDFSQLKKDYGRDQADVIMNITGNIISGQVTGETAKQLSERFGKIMQDRSSVSINSSDTSVSHSKQLDAAIPPSKISCLSSGEFVGMVADDPDNKIELKIFHSSILNDHEALKKEQQGYKPIPVVRQINSSIVQKNYLQIKQEIEDLVNAEMERIMNDPAREGMVLKRVKL